MLGNSRAGLRWARHLIAKSMTWPVSDGQSSGGAVGTTSLVLKIDDVRRLDVHTIPAFAASLAVFLGTPGVVSSAGDDSPCAQSPDGRTFGLTEAFPPCPTAERLTWPSAEGPAAQQQLAAAQDAWDAWRSDRQGAIDRAIRTLNEASVGVPGSSKDSTRLTWNPVVLDLRSALTCADLGLRRRCEAIRLPATVADELVRRTRRQVWHAVNSGLVSTLTGRRSDIFDQRFNVGDGPTARVYTTACPALGRYLQTLSTDAQGHPSTRVFTCDLSDYESACDVMLQEWLENRLELARRRHEGGRRRRPSAASALTRSLDRVQEQAADVVQHEIALLDPLQALIWRHGDRSASFPRVAGRDSPDRVYDRVCRFGSESEDPAAAAVLAARAAEIFRRYADIRDQSERIIVSLLLRDPRRGTPTPTPSTLSGTSDPDFPRWERAIEARLLAGEACVRDLLAILPIEMRAPAGLAASQRSTDEASDADLIPRP